MAKQYHYLAQVTPQAQSENVQFVIVADQPPTPEEVNQAALQASNLLKVGYVEPLGTQAIAEGAKFIPARKDRKGGTALPQEA